MQHETLRIEERAFHGSIGPILRHCAKMLDKLEVICREINEVEADLEEFLEDYYGRVGSVVLRQQAEFSPASPISEQDVFSFDHPALRKLSRNFYVELIRRHHPDHHPHVSSAQVPRTQRIIESYQSGNIALLWKEYFSELCADYDNEEVNDKSKLFDFYHNTQLLLLQQRRRLNALEGSEENQLRLRVFLARIEGVDLIASILQELLGEKRVASEKLGTKRKGAFTPQLTESAA